MSLHWLLRTPVRPSSTSASPKPRNPHADFYASLLPAMIPVALLGSAVYLGLHLVQSRLAHERFLDEADKHIRLLEEEVNSLQTQLRSHANTGSVTSSKGWWA